MEYRRLLLLGLFTLIVLGMKIHPVLAKPPTTAKIVFSGNREKFEQRDIYLMNPDGKEVVNLTNHSADDVLPIFSPNG